MVAAQARPDFSGQWTVESSATPLSTGAPAGRPDQGRLAVGDMGSGWGAQLTITLDGKQLIVEPALFTRYDAAEQPRLVFALDGTETRNAVMISHTTQVRVSRAAWDGQSLRITTLYPGMDPDQGSLSRPKSSTGFRSKHRQRSSSKSAAARRSAEKRPRRERCIGRTDRPIGFYFGGAYGSRASGGTCG